MLEWYTADVTRKSLTNYSQLSMCVLEETAEELEHYVELTKVHESSHRVSGRTENSGHTI